MGRFFYWAGCIAVGSVTAFGIISIISSLSPFTLTSGHGGSLNQLEYKDFISIMLTAVSVILAALGFVIALLAFIGWNSIGERVTSLATTFLTDSLKEGGALNKIVKNEAKDIIYRGIQPVDTEYDESGNGEEDDK